MPPRIARTSVGGARAGGEQPKGERQIGGLLFILSVASNAIEHPFANVVSAGGGRTVGYGSHHVAPASARWEFGTGVAFPRQAPP